MFFRDDKSYPLIFKRAENNPRLTTSIGERDIKMSLFLALPKFLCSQRSLNRIINNFFFPYDNVKTRYTEIAHAPVFTVSN